MEIDRAFLQLLMTNLENQTEAINDLKDDVHAIHTKLAVIEASDSALIAPSKKTRVKDGAAGGTFGGVFVAVIIGLWEYFTKSS